MIDVANLDSLEDSTPVVRGAFVGSRGCHEGRRSSRGRPLLAARLASRLAAIGLEGDRVALFLPNGVLELARAHVDFNHYLEVAALQYATTGHPAGD